MEAGARILWRPESGGINAARLEKARRIHSDEQRTRRLTGGPPAVKTRSRHAARAFDDAFDHGGAWPCHCQAWPARRRRAFPSVRGRPKPPQVEGVGWACRTPNWAAPDRIRVWSPRVGAILCPARPKHLWAPRLEMLLTAAPHGHVAGKEVLAVSFLLKMTLIKL